MADQKSDADSLADILNGVQVDDGVAEEVRVILLAQCDPLTERKMTPKTIKALAEDVVDAVNEETS